jgi:uncharacterized ferritin-like protein (DUF455 family)
MELREFAERILGSESIEAKLAPIEAPVTDAAPGEALRVPLPARPTELRFAGRKQAPAMPHPKTFEQPRKRGVAHHIMANHELQALEVMAFTLCAFPDAPAEFRLGLAAVMADEQRHTRMHIERAAVLGVRFGEFPVNGYFWAKAQNFHSVLDYLAGLPLTFEGCNLDHTLEFEQWFDEAGDRRSAAVMRRIHCDEIEHVKFGLEWLRRLKAPEQSDWEAYAAHLQWPLRPEKSRGKTFHRAPREEAGMTPEFIDRLEQTPPPGAASGDPEQIP